MFVVKSCSYNSINQRNTCPLCSHRKGLKVGLATLGDRWSGVGYKERIFQGQVCEEVINNRNILRLNFLPFSSTKFKQLRTTACIVDYNCKCEEHARINNSDKQGMSFTSRTIIKAIFGLFLQAVLLMH